MKTYKLYALPTSEIEVAQKHRFARATVNYILIYSDEEVPNGKEITEENLFRLTATDTKWVQDCNFAIIFEETKKKENEISDSLSETINRLERILQEESQEESEGNE